MKRLILPIVLCLVSWSSSLFAQIPQKPVDPVPLDPTLDGGAIAPYTQTIAYGSIPAKLTNVIPASGGHPGERYYMWQMSVDGEHWEFITRNNDLVRELEYQPGLLKQAKLYFRRMVSSVNFVGGPISTSPAMKGKSNSGMTGQDETIVKPYPPKPVLEKAYSNVVEINVTGVLSGGVINLGTQTIGQEDSPPVIKSSMSASGVKSTISYQWQKSSDDISWTDIDGATSIEYAIETPLTISKTYYRRVASSGSGELAQTAYSNTVLLTVELPAFKAVPGVVETSDVSHSTKGLKTYEKVAVLDGRELTLTPTYVERAFYYDYKGRVIQTVEKNHLGGISRYSTKYDFVGNVLASHESHKISTTATVADEELTTFTYDNRGRLLSETATVNGSKPASMTYTYDELGKLQTEMVTGRPFTRQSFAYNIQGWLTRKAGVFFSMQLSYFDPRSGSSKARYGGDVAEWKWAHYERGIHSHEFTYDALGRVSSYDHVRSAAWDSNASIQLISPFTEAVTYDKNGNILTMQRAGTNVTSGATATDNLAYTYAGNKLTALNHNNASGSVKAAGSYAYTYDANGNMVKDSRENLDYGYNFLNLLCEVKQGVTTKATYRWLADGTKAGVKNHSGTNGFEYLGSMVYARNPQGGLALESTSFGGGRVVKTSGGYEIHYHVTDHLGNVRATHYTGTTAVTMNDYYAFGKRHNNSSLPIARGDSGNRWQFNGKEKQLVGDVNFLDFGARMYNPEITRWTTQDPLAEKYYSTSPYTYVANNPVKFIDPNGMWIVGMDGKRVTYSKDSGWSENASPDVMRIGNAMLKISTGTERLNFMLNHDEKVSLQISPEESRINGNLQNGVNSKRVKQFSNGSFVAEHNIVIYEGSIDANMKGEGAFSLTGIDKEDVMGAVAGHESGHVEKKNTQMRLEGKSKIAIEAEPSAIERQMIKEYKELKEETYDRYDM